MQSLKPSDAVLDERLRLIVESYRRLTGKPLLSDDLLLPPCRGKGGMGVKSAVTCASTPTLALPDGTTSHSTKPASGQVVGYLQGGGNIAALRAAVWNAPRAIVAHGPEADPVFFYGNAYALRCFEMSFDEFVRLPSRLSAEPLQQEAREQALRTVAEQGYIDGYSGMRIAKSGRRFMITDCTIWNLTDAEGAYHGQAAVFVAAP